MDENPYEAPKVPSSRERLSWLDTRIGRLVVIGLASYFAILLVLIVFRVVHGVMEWFGWSIFP